MSTLRPNEIELKKHYGVDLNKFPWKHHTSYYKLTGEPITTFEKELGAFEDDVIFIFSNPPYSVKVYDFKAKEPDCIIGNIYENEKTNTLYVCLIPFASLREIEEEIETEEEDMFFVGRSTKKENKKSENKTVGFTYAKKSCNHYPGEKYFCGLSPTGSRYINSIFDCEEGYYIALDSGFYNTLKRYYKEGGKWGWLSGRMLVEYNPVKDVLDLSTSDMGWDISKELLILVFEDIKKLIDEGNKVFAGCIGGHGRTGTFLACWCWWNDKNIKDPIKYVRDNYCSEAVESSTQIEFIEKFTGISGLSKKYKTTTKSYAYGSYWNKDNKKVF